MLRSAGITALVAALVFVSVSPAADARGAAPAKRGGEPTLEQVLERYYEAIGGRDALERITTRVSTGRVVDDRPYTGPVRITRFEAYGRERGQRAYVEHLPGGDRTEGFNGETGWVFEDGEVTALVERNRSKLAFVLDPQGPLRIREYFGEMRLTGMTTYEGRSVYAVETDRDPTYYTLYFDVATGLLTNIGYHWSLEQYREVDGVLMPHRVVAGRKGGSVTHAFDEIVTNTPVSGGRFAPPGDESRAW